MIKLHYFLVIFHIIRRNCRNNSIKPYLSGKKLKICKKLKIYDAKNELIYEYYLFLYYVKL